jgi:hypothetical protein
LHRANARCGGCDCGARLHRRIPPPRQAPHKRLARGTSSTRLLRGCAQGARRGAAARTARRHTGAAMAAGVHVARRAPAQRKASWGRQRARAPRRRQRVGALTAAPCMHTVRWVRRRSAPAPSGPSAAASAANKAKDTCGGSHREHTEVLWVKPWAVPGLCARVTRPAAALIARAAGCPARRPTACRGRPPAGLQRPLPDI